MHGHLPLRENATLIENISGTIHDLRAGEKPALREIGLGDDVAEAARRCAYIAADTWPPGAPPFCGAPVRPGSAYCATHARLCTADPASAEGVRIAIAQDLAARVVPPPELDHLAPVALPEPIEPDALDQRELPLTAQPDHVADEKEEA